MNSSVYFSICIGFSFDGDHATLWPSPARAMVKGTHVQLQNLNMEQAIKHAVDNALQLSGIVKRSDMEELMGTLEKRITESIAAQLGTVTKPLADRIDALEAKVALYEK